MASPAGLLLLLLLLLLPLGQRWAGAADPTAVLCAGTACYTAHWGKLSAGEAQQRCSANGGNLATVRSEEEARHIQRALARLLKASAAPEPGRTGKFWIGLRRDKGKCPDSSLPLKGFSWVDGGEDTSYTNWHKEAKSSCLSSRCVSLMLEPSRPPAPSRLPKWSDSPCGHPSTPGFSTEGFVCKFGFEGMCRPLALGGPGQVSYSTPFQATTSSLDSVPFASMATVVCGGEESRSQYFLCKRREPAGPEGPEGPEAFEWGAPGPLCVDPSLGCSFNNGGCQQNCFEGGNGSVRCGCRAGFRLLDDLVACAPRDPCSSGPCPAGAACVPAPRGGYSCRCAPGHRLDSAGGGCVDVDECQDAPCAQDCVNTPGGFRCQCWVGFAPGGPEGPDAGACLDVDECASGHAPCAQGCVNTQGSFYCSCEVGYALSPQDDTQCEDQDECADPAGSPCPGPGLCVNTPGSFRCTCPPGAELAPDGGSCTERPPASGPAAGAPQDEDGGAGRGGASPPATSASWASAGRSEATPATRGPSLPPTVPATSIPEEPLAPRGAPGIATEPDAPPPTADDSVATQSEDGGTDGQKLLLFYILGSVVGISLLLALALGLLVCRRRRAQRAEVKKPRQAADSYSWEPERAERRAAENQYSLTPGTDC